MFICPEATLLTIGENATLMQSMLSQCTETRTTVAFFDVIGDRNPDPIRYMDDIATVRENAGAIGLNYGTACYPFVGTTIMQTCAIDYTNFYGGGIEQLEALLNPP